MNPLVGESAAERLAHITKEEFIGMLQENADEPYAVEIAETVFRSEKTVNNKKPVSYGKPGKNREQEKNGKSVKVGKSAETGTRIETTQDLRRLIEEALTFLPKAEQKEAVRKSCQRTFQALRIDVNSEFEVLFSFLEKLPDALAPGGRVAVLTFHSGEDRLVKRAFKEGLKAGIYQDIAKEVIRPSAEECRRNGRARSTKLRWAVRA